MHDPQGNKAYWLVPIMCNEKACGFAQVQKDYLVSKISAFGSSPDDTKSWIDASFFKAPPPNLLKEIQTRYPEMALSEPIFSYDKTPAKWGWKITLTNDQTFEVFVGPANWYKQAKTEPGFEG